MASDEYRKLSRTEIVKNMRTIRKWRLLKGKLHREYNFKTFDDAISFMLRSSLEVTKLDHHPEWFNVYNKVIVDLVTHDVSGISNYDFILAKKLEKVASTFNPR